MSVSALGRSAAFALLYLAAVFAGRLTAMDGTSLSLVWPAAGVAAVWFACQRKAGTLWVDVAALSAITFLVNVWTGAPSLLAAGFVLANLVQVAAFLILTARLTPHLWGAGGTEPLARLTDLWRLLVAAAGSTSCGAAIGPTAVWFVTGHYSWPPAAVWLTRNMVSVVLITAVGLRLGYLITAWPKQSRGSWWPVARRAFRRWLGTGKAAELLAVAVCSVVAYTVTFGLLDGLPIAFTLIVITVWVALRFDTTLVVLHNLVLGTLAVALTLQGSGPFAQIASYSTRALVVQAFVGVVAVVGLALALGRDEREMLLAGVRRGQQESDEKAQLFSTVVDSMAEGLIVVDAEHRFLLLNPAADDLLGGVDRGSDRIASSSEYGCFYPDGRSMPDAELPYARALAGEELRNFDLVIRNAGTPSRRILSINATPLSMGRGVAAVVVFRDVTAERRHRDELTAFAGVVAHDLLNPLTTIEGWSEVLQDSLRDGVDWTTGPTASPDTAADGLARINRASVRMRELVSDLLGYTTARDGHLHPADVQLRAVLDDVVAARMDHPVEEPDLRPDIAYGPLHAVRADPALLRQLLDNLIGNALKYTAPGMAPQVSIESSREDGRVTVTVADRGIGVPTGQHVAIFDTFHRAHTDGRYTGTGLGLAICQRIVEQHGGHILEEDNPGGGTRISFSLPEAPTGLPAIRAAEFAVQQSTPARDISSRV